MTQNDLNRAVARATEKGLSRWWNICRRVMGVAAFGAEPTRQAMCSFLGERLPKKGSRLAHARIPTIASLLFRAFLP